MSEAAKLKTDISNLHPVPAVSSREKELEDKLAGQIKEMNQFTYIVSHDLQAPLRTVTGFLELLVKRYGDKLDDSGKQFIDYAVKGATKMKYLVFDLLEYSRLNTQTAPFADVDLNEVFAEAKEKLAVEIEQTGAIVTAEKLPVVAGDRKQLLQLITHLLQNGVKFRSEVTPEIRVSAVAENGSWKIDFSDNGIGIDAAYHEKIFIIFRRLHTDEVKYPGTGTGLAICKKVAEIHGGNIRVSSAEGSGSVFTVLLPVNEKN